MILFITEKDNFAPISLRNVYPTQIVPKPSVRDTTFIKCILFQSIDLTRMEAIREHDLRKRNNVLFISSKSAWKKLTISYMYAALGIRAT